MTLLIWHRKNHDDFTVTEVETESDADQFVTEAKNRGGFWNPRKSFAFVPWHSISYIEVVL